MELDFTQWMAIIALVLGGGSGIWLIAQTVLSKKLKTPADRQSEIEFGVGLLKSQIERAERDAARWLEVEQFLREELRKTDADVERLQGLLTSAHEQITDLIAERNDLRARLAMLAVKVARGEKIKMSDITGDVTNTGPIDIEDVEDDLIIRG